MTTSRKVQVQANGSPLTDRYVSLSTYRIFCTDVFVVGVVDGTGRLADHRSLLTTTDLTKARRQANNLTARWGGPAESTELREFLPREAKRPKQPATRRSRSKRPENVTQVFDIRQGSRGRFNVRWHEQGIPNHRTQRFDTAAQAHDFHHRLTILMKETD